MSTLTVSRAAIVAEARKHLRTPFRHQGRCVGVGLDCVGLLAVVAKALEIPYRDQRAYGRLPQNEREHNRLRYTLMDCLRSCCDQLASPSDARNGSVLVFEFCGPDWPQHVGIKTDRGFIHTHGRIGFVTEHGYSEEWRARTVAALDFKGVVD